MSNQMQALGVIIAVFGVTAAVLFFHQQQKENITSHKNDVETQVNQESQTPTPSPSPSPRESSRITLEEEWSYIVGRDNRNSMQVIVEVDDEIVTDVEVNHTASSLKSEHHHHEFDLIYRDQVIGKPISEVNVERVAGSTVTTDVFNETIANMREQL